MRARIFRTYGFCSNPSLSRSCNVSAILNKLPYDILAARPSNSAFHKLCLPTTPTPFGIKPFLGLSLRFCLRPHSSGQLEFSKLRKRFLNNAYTNYIMLDRKSPIPKLYIRSSTWNLILRKSLLCFVVDMKTFYHTYNTDSQDETNLPTTTSFLCNKLLYVTYYTCCSQLRQKSRPCNY